MTFRSSFRRSSFLLATAFGLMVVGLLNITDRTLLAQTKSKTNGASAPQTNPDSKANPDSKEKKLESITLGGGCFWCVEAVFQRVVGVSKVVSGYTGGKTPNPTYKEVSNYDTGHAEVVQVTFDPEQVALEDILEIFWYTHDPTTPNQQGPDRGTQYRSAVFYDSDAQRDTAEKVMARITEEKVYKRPIVTEISPLGVFYPAEDYHQNYFNLNKNANPYCRSVVLPKIQKFEKLFKDKSVTQKEKDAKKN